MGPRKPTFMFFSKSHRAVNSLLLDLSAKQSFFSRAHAGKLKFSGNKQWMNVGILNMVCGASFGLKRYNIPHIVQLNKTLLLPNIYSMNI